MEMLQGNTYGLPVKVESCGGRVVRSGDVVRGEFVIGGVAKMYEDDGSGEVYWSNEADAFIVPLTERDTFSLEGSVECQVRMLMVDGSVSGSVPELYYVYDSISRTKLGGGAVGGNGEVLNITLLKEISSGGGGGTSYYPDLNGLPAINGVTLVGNKSGEDLGLASKGDIPDVSQFAKKSEVPTKVSQLANDEKFAKEEYVNTKVAELVNSAPETLDTLGELANAIKENQNLIDVIKVPTKTSELTNDSGFITADDIPQQEVDLTNYYTKSETEAYVQEQIKDLASKDYIDSLVGNINTELENVLGV